jgi:hypothetical protein
VIFNLNLQSVLEEAISYWKETYLSGVEIHKLTRDVLSQCKAMEAPSDCSLDDFFEIVLRMAAKLPRMAVMRLRHLGFVSTQTQ